MWPPASGVARMAPRLPWRASAPTPANRPHWIQSANPAAPAHISNQPSLIRNPADYVILTVFFEVPPQNEMILLPVLFLPGVLSARLSCYHCISQVPLELVQQDAKDAFKTFMFTK